MICGIKEMEQEMNIEYFDYQSKMIEELARLDTSTGVTLKMGQGKTLTILTHVINHAQFPCLIVAPKLVSQTVWPKEIAKWFGLRDVVVFTGKTIKQRMDLLESSHARFWCISPGLLGWLLEALQHIPRCFASCIIDESTTFKDPTTGQTKNMARLSKLMPKVYTLTGCPDPQGLENLWAQVYMLDHGLRLGTSYPTFLKTNFLPERTHPRNKYIVFSWAPKEGTRRRLTQTIRDIVLTGERFGANNPRPDPHIVAYELPASREYLTAVDTLRKKKELNGMVPTNAAHLSGMLRQMSSGFLYDADKKPMWLHDTKFQWIQEQLEDLGEPVIVCYWYNAERDKLREMFPKALMLDSAKAESEWNTGKHKIALMQPQSAGKGLNLQDGGAVMIWYSLPWSYELWTQTIARIDRTGQKRPVRILVPMLEGSTDMSVYGSLLAHHSEQQLTRDALSFMGMEDIL